MKLNRESVQNSQTFNEAADHVIEICSAEINYEAMKHELE